MVGPHGLKDVRAVRNRLFAVSAQLTSTPAERNARQAADTPTGRGQSGNETDARDDRVKAGRA